MGSRTSSKISSNRCALATRHCDDELTRQDKRCSRKLNMLCLSERMHLGELKRRRYPWRLFILVKLCLFLRQAIRKIPKSPKKSWHNAPVSLLLPQYVAYELECVF